MVNSFSNLTDNKAFMEILLDSMLVTLYVMWRNVFKIFILFAKLNYS